MISPEEIVKKRMYENDAFSKWMGIRINHVAEGACETCLVIRPDMVNGFGIAHGGIVYALADSTLAFASNTFGKHSFSFETSISHLHKSKTGDTLIATAIMRKKGWKISVFDVEVKNGDNLVALFKGTVYHDKQEWV